MAKVKCFSKFQTILAADGSVLNGGFVRSFQNGTTTPLAHYTDASGSGSTTSTTIPSNGRVEVWLDENVAYRIEILDTDGTTVLYRQDNVYGAMNVDSSTLADGVTTLAKLANQSPSTVLGTSASGAATALTLDADLALGSDNIHLDDGEHRKITRDEVSGSGTINKEYGKEYLHSGHEAYLFYIRFDDTTSIPTLELSSDDGSTYDSLYTVAQSSIGSTTYSSTGSALTTIPFLYNGAEVTNGTDSPDDSGKGMFELTIYNLHSTTKATCGVIKAVAKGTSSQATSIVSFKANNTNKHNGVRITTVGAGGFLVSITGLGGTYG